ncbi:unnamed protein product [Linum tenue]|uniref:Uncharacterized protein n=1 Tax=Linum tenue TaxID=586396 RepID=A0AAV0MZ80_9ROSI|nr:unnamed protein product [Linum tenue]
MLQTPAFMTQYPWSTRTVPSSFLMSSQPPAQTHTPEQLLAMEEDVYEEQVTTLPLLASNPSRDKMSILPVIVRNLVCEQPVQFEPRRGANLHDYLFSP